MYYNVKREHGWSFYGNGQQFFPQQMLDKFMNTWKIKIMKNPKIVEKSYWPAEIL
jgi:hypothetical protein